MSIHPIAGHKSNTAMVFELLSTLLHITHVRLNMSNRALECPRKCAWEGSAYQHVNVMNQVQRKEGQLHDEVSVVHIGTFALPSAHVVQIPQVNSVPGLERKGLLMRMAGKILRVCEWYILEFPISEHHSCDIITLLWFLKLSHFKQKTSLKRLTLLWHVQCKW